MGAHLDGRGAGELEHVGVAHFGVLLAEVLDEGERVGQPRVGGVLDLWVEADGTVGAAALGPLVGADGLQAATRA